MPLKWKSYFDITFMLAASDPNLHDSFSSAKLSLCTRTCWSTQAVVHLRCYNSVKLHTWYVIGCHLKEPQKSRWNDWNISTFWADPESKLGPAQHSTLLQNNDEWVKKDQLQVLVGRTGSSAPNIWRMLHRSLLGWERGSLSHCCSPPKSPYEQKFWSIVSLLYFVLWLKLW